MTMLPGDPVDDLRRAMEALKLSDPDGWPESVAMVAGAVAGLDSGLLDLLADASVQVAATAHRMAQEAADEIPPGNPEQN